MEIDEHENIRYYNLEHQLHRDDIDTDTGYTLPAVEYKDETKYWYKSGKRHRDDRDLITGLTLPAIERYDGSKGWWINGIEYILIKI